jgi:hypothetical protein
MSLEVWIRDLFYRYRGGLVGGVLDAEVGVVVHGATAGKFVSTGVASVRGRFDPGRNRRNHAVGCWHREGVMVVCTHHRGLAVSLHLLLSESILVFYLRFSDL